MIFILYILYIYFETLGTPYLPFALRLREWVVVCKRLRLQLYQRPPSTVLMFAAMTTQTMEFEVDK